jgi:hypothetical protein
VLDFERKLVSLQFLAGDSGHENLRLVETLILTRQGDDRRRYKPTKPGIREKMFKNY